MKCKTKINTEVTIAAEISNTYKTRCSFNKAVVKAKIFHKILENVQL